jgi:hypothetical protein
MTPPRVRLPLFAIWKLQSIIAAPRGFSMPTHIAISAMSVPPTQQTRLLSLKVVRVNPLKLVLANRRDAYVVIDH